MKGDIGHRVPYITLYHLSPIHLYLSFLLAKIPNTAIWLEATKRKVVRSGIFYELCLIGEFRQLNI